MRNKTIVAVVMVLSLAVFTLSVSRRSSYVDISGHVYDAARGAAPAAGAMVSNDWDSTTAITNVHGEFRLRVRRVAADEFIKFTARAGESEGCHQRIGTLESIPVDIYLKGRRC
jgi:hypothetical protein